MATRIHFTAWGRGNFEAPAYAMTGEVWEQDCERVAQAIARKSGAEVCRNVRPEGFHRAIDGACHAQFSFTIGTPVQGGGWSPVAEVWFAFDHPIFYID